jgi:hypothetical protein
MAWGKKPKFENFITTLRPLSIKEMKKLIKSFPEVLYYALGSKATDTAIKIEKLKNYDDFLKDSLKIKELRNPLFKHLFPKARFYQNRMLDKEQYYPYLITIVGDTLFDPIVGYNQLLIKSRQTINDENIVDLAKAFVVMSFGNASNLDTELIVTKPDSFNFPKITFLKTEKLFKATELDAHIVWLKTKVGEKILDWAFDISWKVKGQFGRIIIFFPGERSMDIYYYPFRIERHEKSTLQEGDGIIINK